VTLSALWVSTKRGSGALACKVLVLGYNGRMTRLAHNQKGVASLLVVIVALAVIVAVVFVIWSFMVDGDNDRVPVPQASNQEQTSVKEEEPAAEPAFVQQTFQQTKSPHFVSSQPTNNQLVNSLVEEVKLNFNFDVVEGSKISVTKDGQDVTTGPTTIAGDNLSMTVPVAADETGNYSVTYTACWPDRSCHDGSFGFSVKLDE